MRTLICLFLLAGCRASPPPLPSRAVVAQQPFCTRTLGTPECYASPALLPDHPEGIADTPDRVPPAATPWWKKVTDNWRNQ
jgi:hypothetical protein